MKIKVNKFTSSVAGATIFLVFASVLIRLIGFLREIIYAKEFGLSKAFDVYLIASIIPITTNTVLYYIGQNFFIPFYSQLEVTDKTLSSKFLKSSFFAFGLLGLIIGTLYYIFANNILVLFLNSSIPSNDISISVFRVFSFTIPFSAFITIIAAYLNKEKLFLPPAFSSLFLNLFVIFSVVFFNSEIGIMSIAYGYLVGSIFQLLYLIHTSKMKNIIFSQINKSDWKFNKLINSSLLMIIVIESIGQLYMISDRFFFSSVREGGISALNYAQTLFSLPISILIIPLSTALFPKLSNDVYKNNSNEILASFKDTITVTLIIIIPVFYVFNYFGENIISILLQRGEFKNSDTIITANTLKYLNIGLLFYALYSIFNKLLYSAKLIKQLLLITILGIIVKILFNFLLVSKLNYIGLALSTSISYLFFFLASLFLISKRFDYKWISIAVNEFVFLIINGLISFIITKLFITTFIIYSNYFFLISILFFVIIYFFNLLVCKFNGLLLMLNRLLRVGKFNNL